MMSNLLNSSIIIVSKNPLFNFNFSASYEPIRSNSLNYNKKFSKKFTSSNQSFFGKKNDFYHPDLLKNCSEEEKKLFKMIQEHMEEFQQKQLSSQKVEEISTVNTKELSLPSANSNNVSESSSVDLNNVTESISSSSKIKELTEFFEIDLYYAALDNCHNKYYKHIDFSKFAENYAEEIPFANQGYTLFNECPLVNPLFDFKECREYYRLSDIQYYLNKCYELKETSLIKESLMDKETFANVEKILELVGKVSLNIMDLFLNYVQIDNNLLLTNKSLLFEEYYQIGLFVIFAVFLSVFILVASYVLVIQKPESEKLSPYECGFEPYEDAKNKFDVQFYIVAILFVLFDIEIIVMLPWCLSLSTLSLLGYWLIIEFLLELGLAFLYVWVLGAFDW